VVWVEKLPTGVFLRTINYRHFANDLINETTISDLLKTTVKLSEL